MASPRPVSRRQVYLRVGRVRSYRPTCPTFIPDPGKSRMAHPFIDLIGLRFEERRPGYSRCTLAVSEKHLNPHGVVHGAVAFALADTGMGAALFPTLSPGEICATVEIKISYFKPVVSGALSCVTEMVNRGKKLLWILVVLLLPLLGLIIWFIAGPRGGKG